jgi:hypothetical protein
VFEAAIDARSPSMARPLDSKNHARISGDGQYRGILKNRQVGSLR